MAEKGPVSEIFHACTRAWFDSSFPEPTPVQAQAWPLIATGRSTLLLAPTGSGKTLAAFLAAIDRIMFGDADRHADPGVRVLYVSPLKALGVDVDRNLRRPLAGLRDAAQQQGVVHRVPTVAIRSGDTPASERRRIVREPPEILITTPESLYLLLTSRSREILRTVQTVIVDEIHAIAATKRGAHLFVSLERLEQLRRTDGEAASPVQRIGLSATQRPLSEIARLLGGAEADADPLHAPVPRPVEIVDASAPRQFDLVVETPVEDMAKLAARESAGSDKEGTDASDAGIPSIWPSIHPRLVELIRQNTSTMIFVNNRRLAERLAAAVNELADEEIALAHHGSLARDTRATIEARLKDGDLPAIVATSSMELGIDMGAVDLVIQIEAPPSIASGTQRIGRAGHQVGARSRGVIFPKFRGDLVACTAATGAMREGWVEETHYPRNPLDILAQQVIATTARGSIPVDQLYALMRGAAPFADLPRESFDGVLDLLSGRYPSDEFSELRPRITWDRVAGTVTPRQGAQRLAVLNGGTIPDRGLYGVYLLGREGQPGSRVGELDEEMVFETRPGDVFRLGASTWRAIEITRDRVVVVPAPGEPGRMPFWHGDGVGRPHQFGLAIGTLTRELIQSTPDEARQRLREEHALEDRAATNLLAYLAAQQEATGEVPSDRTIVIERFADEVGDWRLVVLTPFGSRVHAPWAMLVSARLEDLTEGEVDCLWTDDGMVFRIPETDVLPPEDCFFPDPDEVEDALVRRVGTTALFAGKFRENAARALLLPRRYPGRRTPLWLQRRRSADLLRVARQYREFPILLETYRECLRDVFDVAGLTTVLQQVRQREIRVRHVETDAPSPFAAAVMFSYTGNFIYETDAPSAERRAQALTLDYGQLRELLGSADYTRLLDADEIAAYARELQRLDARPLRHADDLHDLLLRLGDLTRDEVGQRCREEDIADDLPAQWIMELLERRRAFETAIGGVPRLVAAEDGGRMRDALGAVVPDDLPAALLEPVDGALRDLVSRFARTHGPFTAEQVAARLGLGVDPVLAALRELADRERIFEGEFLSAGSREWCDAQVLRVLKRRSLARLREQVQPVDPLALARFLPEWHGLSQPRRGLDGLLDAVEQIQGLALPPSTLENEILTQRVSGYRAADLDELCVAGEIVWRGFPGGGSDGRVALYLTDHFPLLSPPRDELPDELAAGLCDLLAARGALFFDQLVSELGGFPNDVLSLLWELVWAGHVTNDTLAPLRALRADAPSQRRVTRTRRAFRSRRQGLPAGSQGRWSLLPWTEPAPTVTERQTALATQLIERYGILTREMLTREQIAGGFAGLYPVLRAMEESGRVRRGYFVEGLGAAQFAAPGAEDQLRAQRRPDDADSPLVLAATDPANAWGGVLPWPDSGNRQRPQRVAGAKVILLGGQLIGHLSRARDHLLCFLPSQEPELSTVRRKLAETVASIARPGAAVQLKRIDGADPEDAPIMVDLVAAGFRPTSRGLLHNGRHVDV